MTQKTPIIHKSTYVDPSAVIIGNTTIHADCSIFPHAVIRGDENSIIINEGSNIQDCCVIHVDENHHATIGKHVSIGHGAIVHGSIIEDNCIIGIHATILNGAVIKKGSIIGANALVTSGTVIPENSLVLGVPGKVVKQDEKFEKQAIKNADIYIHLRKNYLEKQYPRFQ
jgi:carbonic anhydrase/acetyltransferase-like protein (isoleucine patch superfamily)